MHMTFYWGKDATILFDGWKTSTWITYFPSLLVLFLVSVFYAYLSIARVSPPSSSFLSAKPTYSVISDPLVSDGGRKRKLPVPSSRKLLNSVIFGVRVAISYLLMLAVMSFNGGVFIAVVLGFTVGYYFASDLSSDSDSSADEGDICCA